MTAQEMTRTLQTAIAHMFVLAAGPSVEVVIDDVSIPGGRIRTIVLHTGSGPAGDSF